MSNFFRFLLFLLVIFLGYLTAYYTAGVENGYNDPFDFSYFEEKMDGLIEFEHEKETLTSDHHKNGMIFLENEQYYDALDEFFAALNEEDNAENNYYIGHTYLKNEEYSDADVYFNIALEKDPNFTEAYKERGISKYHQDFYDDALEDLQSSADLNPDDPETYYYLALCYDADSQKELALQSVETALNYETENIDYWFKAAYLSYELKRYELCANYYNSLLAIDSAHKFSLINLGLCYDDMGKKDSAIYCYDKALEYYPDYALAYNNKGYIYQTQNDYIKAIEQYSLAISYDPNDTRPRWNRADCYFANEEYDYAISDLKKVYEMNSGYYNTLFQIAECYEKKGNKSQALHYYTEYKLKANSESIYFDEADKRIKNLK